MVVTSFKPQTVARGIVGAPQISGDGSTVVWNQNVNGNVDIFRYRDGQVDRISSDPRQDIHPSINHDGSVISWCRMSNIDPDEPGSNFDIVVWRNGQESILANSPANETDPVVTPDGKKIAWSSDIDGKQVNYAVELHEDGKTTRLTPDDGCNLFPVFAGNSGQMIWRTLYQGGSDLSMRTADGKVDQLTFDEEEEIKPSISADGNSVFYHTVSPEGDDDIYRLDLSPRQSTAVSKNKKVDESWPVCSADGKAVAWTNFDHRGFLGKVDVQLMLQENGQTSQITSGKGMHTNVAMAATPDHMAYLWLNPKDTNQSEVRILNRQS